MHFHTPYFLNSIFKLALPLRHHILLDRYENQINESLVLRIADGLVASGLADAGFKYASFILFHFPPFFSEAAH